jgi:integrase
MEGKKEIQRALGTPDRKAAEKSARRVAVEFDEMFDRLRKGASTVDPLSQTDGYDPNRQIGPMTPDEKAALDLAVQEEATRDPAVARILVEDAKQVRKMERERRRDAIIDAAVTRGLEKFSQALSSPVVPLVPEVATQASTVPEAAAVGLAEALHQWEKDRSPGGSTLSTTHTVVSRFWEVCGKLPLRKIQREHILQFQAALAKEGKQPGTIKNYVALLRAVLGVAVDEKWITSNPVTGVKTKGQKSAKTARLPFTVDEINLIFGKLPANGAKYWLPIIGLYTGLRLEEIGQLAPADIVQERYRDAEGKEHKVHVIYATEEGDGKRLKNESSRRRIPVHNTLVELGFIKYAHSQKGAQLFPELKPDKNGRRTASFSLWFGRIKRGLGITDNRKAFHSYRHVFKDIMREVGVAEEVSDALSGHTNGSVSRNYGSGYFPLRPLVDAINLYEVHGVKLPTV